MVRIRVVEGSCWPCKKRRTKCDLAKPVCKRCAQTGASCDYSAQLIRWSSRPSVRDVPPPYQLPGLGRDGLGADEKLALDYFHGRVWPLLQTSECPCPPPLPVALEHRVVLLAACALAGSHRLLQSGDSRRRGSAATRLECLAAIRSEVDARCDGSKSSSLNVLLFAVLLLHLHDGFMEPDGEGSSTASHHRGVAAILSQLGGVESVLPTAPESLQMLLSEFLSADLTTALLRGTAPWYPPAIWDTVDKGAVWWGRDPWNRRSLAQVLRATSALAFYHDSIVKGADVVSMDQVRGFEELFCPAYPSDGTSPAAAADSCRGTRDVEAAHAFTLIRSFQHAALIFLYRAVCGLPVLHPLVQQHVQSCLDCVFDIERSSKVLHCVIFPLCVAGAHAQLPQHQQVIVELLGYLYDHMRFVSVRAVAETLRANWESERVDLPWVEQFAALSEHVLVL